MSNIILGKEKAWATAISTFLIALLLQRLGVTPEGPSDSQVAELIVIGTEILTALIAGGITFATTYITGNSGFTKTDEIPAVIVPEDTVPDGEFVEDTTVTFR